jgi:hypothetical protein
MRNGGYARVERPWSAALEVSSPFPAGFMAALVASAVSLGLPARRRFGPVHAAVARVGVPERPLALALRALPRVARPDLDDLKRAVTSAWPRLAERSPALPDDPGPLALLALDRRSALTVFVFGEAPVPLLVAKLPRAGHDGVEREVAALRAASGTGIAPAFLGCVDQVRVQEAIAGTRLAVDPVRLSTARALRWSPQAASLAARLEAVAAATATPAVPIRFRSPPELALDTPALGARTRRLLAAAVRDVAVVERACLAHGDTAPANCLFHGDRLSGLVDWERGTTAGAPGFDVLNVAVAMVVHGVGLTRWSQERVASAFAAAWDRAPLFLEARGAARRAALAAGYPESVLESLEIAFLGHRLQRRLEGPGWHVTSAATAAAMLERACAG